MSESIHGKQALVTGGSRGIGRAIARRLLEEGVEVIICGRDQQSLERAVAELAGETGGRVAGVTADVAKQDDVVRLFRFATERWAGLDILVNNAGVGLFKSTAEIDPAEWDRLIGTNLSGVFYCCREALPLMRPRGGGFVVNISSLAGKNPFAGGSAYNASKFGLNGFSEAMMLDHRHDNIRVCYVMPGSVATEFTPGSSAAAWKIAPEDIAEIVALVLKLPARTLVSRVEVRPSKPPR